MTTVPDKRIKKYSVETLLKNKLFEDEHLLILNKPKGISTTRERNGNFYNVLDLVREVYPKIRVAHRLDKLTTGALVFAKNFEAYRNMAIAFQKREVEKTYLALVNGVHYFKNDKIIVDLDTSGNKTKIVRKGKKSITYVDVVKNFGHYTLVAVTPKTGKTHQIRSLLAYLGAPIVGDSQYFGKSLFLSEIKPKFKGEENPLGLNIGFLLHAWKIGFKHPVENKQEIFVEAPPDKNFSACLKILERYDKYSL